MNFVLSRTTTGSKDFQELVSCLDHELWVELKEDQATYDQFNKVDDLETAVVVFADGEPAACGCFKAIDANTVEIKRMFVQKEFRGNGLSKMVLNELEKWAIALSYNYAVLETSIRFDKAINLYKTNGYHVIPNYGPYVGLDESICMKKILQR